MCTTCGCGHTHSVHPNSRPEKTRSVRVEEDILARNNADAALLRTFFRQHRILALNLVSSPAPPCRERATVLLLTDFRARRCSARWHVRNGYSAVTAQLLPLSVSA